MGKASIDGWTAGCLSQRDHVLTCHHNSLFAAGRDAQHAAFSYKTKHQCAVGISVKVPTWALGGFRDKALCDFKASHPNSSNQSSSNS
jgi:hypothetical protein